MSSLRTLTKMSFRSSNYARDGVARKVMTTNAFSHLAALSDSEEDTPVIRVTEVAAPCVTVLSPAAVELQAMLASDPVLQAMIRGDTLWGDLMYEEEEAEDRRLGRVRPTFNAAAHRAQREADERAAAEAERERLDAAEGALWTQPFAGNLEMYWSDVYDTRALTDAEYEACMTWLYDQGWELQGEIRSGFQGWPADLPPRVWVAPRASSRFDALAVTHAPHVTGTHAHTESHAPAPSTGHQGRRQPAPKKSVTVPRFCRDSCGGVPCADAACRYVHADTMPRLDKPCGFGAACGASDPVKRAACLYMHPGETWTADLCVTRPAPAPAS